MVKKKKKSKELSEVFFEMTGKVYVVEKLNGKEIERTEIDGTTVLNCLIDILEKSIDAETVRRKIKNEYAIRKGR
jgi:hypothetical protein